MKKIVLVLLMGILVLSNFNGCAFLLADALLSEDETTTANENVDNNETDGNKVDTETTSPQNNNVLSSDNPSVKTKELQIELITKDLDFTDYEDDYGWYTPKDGYKYVMTEFKFTNIGDEDEYVSIYDFDCYADGTLCDQDFGVIDQDFMNTNLSSGRNVSFKVAFEVPVNAEEIELEYTVNMFSDKKIIVKLK